MCRLTAKDKMNITCKDGTICIEADNYQEQCEVYSGPLCNFPCDASNCEITVELDTVCKEFYCFSPSPAPNPPYPGYNHLALQICLPIIFLIFLVLIIWCGRKWKSRADTRRRGSLYFYFEY